MFFKHNNHNNEAKKLPRPVHEYMQYRFILLSEYLDTLKCFEYDGVVNGEKVRCVRIFSPYRANDKHVDIMTNLELEQHPEMLLFEGHIGKQGNAYVADRRLPIKQLKMR